MRDYIDVTGKNEDEAISKALAQLGLDRDDVSVEVLERAKSGFLGLGACPAKIRVYYGPEEEAPAATPAPAPAPAPKPEPKPEPEPEGESVRAGDTYTISVTLEGGTGRATVESPAKLRYDETGKCWATIVWSSPNFDYMKVDGQKYELISEPGANSTFEIPVSAFNQPLTVIADTVAMSEPHEVEYTLTFDSASMQDA